MLARADARGHIGIRRFRGTARRATWVPLAVLALVTVVSANAATTSHTFRPLYQRCPRSAVETHNVRGMLEGAWHSIPRVFATVNHVQGRAEPVSPANTFVIEVTGLNPENPSHAAARLRAEARRACGARIAAASWAIRLYFSEAIIADTTGVAFVARERSGRWVIWRAR